MHVWGVLSGRWRAMCGLARCILIIPYHLDYARHTRTGFDVIFRTEQEHSIMLSLKLVCVLGTVLSAAGGTIPANAATTNVVLAGAYGNLAGRALHRLSL